MPINKLKSVPILVITLIFTLLISAYVLILISWSQDWHQYSHKPELSKTQKNLSKFLGYEVKIGSSDRSSWYGQGYLNYHVSGYIFSDNSRNELDKISEDYFFHRYNVTVSGTDSSGNILEVTLNEKTWLDMYLNSKIRPYSIWNVLPSLGFVLFLSILLQRISLPFSMLPIFFWIIGSGLTRAVFGYDLFQTTVWLLWFGVSCLVVFVPICVYKTKALRKVVYPLLVVLLFTSILDTGFFIIDNEDQIGFFYMIKYVDWAVEVYVLFFHAFLMIIGLLFIISYIRSLSRMEVLKIASCLCLINFALSLNLLISLYG